MKDPAFLFYSNDFLSGTMLMTNEQVGKYIRLLCLQHQKGHLREKDMLNICETHDEDIFSNFKKDEEGNYYNERLEEEANKRRNFVESRRNARKKCDEDKVKIYMILDKDTKYVKIGSSVNPQRRYAEMCNQKNPAITAGNRNYELIFVSRIVERKVEKEIHQLFKDKNITGGWFSLNKKDIEFIKKRMKNIRKTYEEHTKNVCKTYEQRTENENENENENVIINKNENKEKRGLGEKEKEKIKVLEEWETQFEEFYKAYPRKVAKQRVKNWFKQNKPSCELFSCMMSALEQFRTSKGWLEDGGQFIPYPSTWLNQRRWEDEGIEDLGGISDFKKLYEEAVAEDEQEGNDTTDNFFSW